MKIWWEGVLTWKGGAPQTLDPGQRSHWVWTLPKLLASCHVLRLRSYAKGKSDFLNTSSGSMCRYESFGERNLRLALRWLSGKESACQQRRLKRCRFNPWVEKMPWRRKWQPAPVCLAWEIPWTEEPGGLQSMGLKEPDTTWWLNNIYQIHRDRK